MSTQQDSTNESGPRGPRGPRGEKGKPGQATLPPRVSRALVILFLLPSLIAVGAVIGVIISTQSYQAAQRRDQQLQAQQGRIVEQKICQTLHALAAHKPPPGNPATNPSRAYLQGQYRTLIQLGPDLGCDQLHHR